MVALLKIFGNVDFAHAILNARFFCAILMCVFALIIRATILRIFTRPFYAPYFKIHFENSLSKIHTIDILICLIAQKFIHKKSIKIRAKLAKCRAFFDKCNKARNANGSEFAIKLFRAEFLIKKILKIYTIVLYNSMKN